MGVDDGLLAVVVGVVMRVRVPGDLRLDVVEDHAPDLAADVLDVDLGALEHEAPDLSRLVDQDHAVGLRRDDRRVGDRQDGRRIDQNNVVLVAHGAEERGHRGRRQELGGVGRDGARLDDVQVVEARRGHDVFHLEASHEDVGDGADAVAPRRTPDEDVGEAGLALDAEEAVDARSSHVPTDEQRALPALREGEREVDDGRRLAFLEGRAGDDQDLPRAFHPGELDVRAERPVGFRHR